VRKSDLFELVRQIGKIAADEKPIIVGSQAAHAVAENLPDIAKKSIECDFLFFGGKSETRTAVNKKLGVFSNFQLENGFYADALGLATVVLPTDWQKRLQPLSNENGEIIAYCAEIHDVAVSKLIAGREKDFEFLSDAFRLEIISVKEFITRVQLVKSMPQNAVLPDRLEKLEKHLSSQKIEAKIISPIREFLRQLRVKRQI
jgi:hypothetical protein